MEQKGIRFWNKQAKKFDLTDQPKSEIRIAKYALIKNEIGSTSRVLDVGCATGSMCFELSPDVHEMIGIDFSEEMIHQAQLKSKEHSTKNCRFYCADLNQINELNLSFDTIICFYVLHLVKSPEEAIQQLYHLLPPSGKLICEIPILKKGNNLKFFFLKILTKLSGLPYLHHLNPGQIRDLLISKGFEIQTFEEFEHSTPSIYIIARKN